MATARGDHVSTDWLRRLEDRDPELKAAGERFDKAMAERPRGLSHDEIVAIYGEQTEDASNGESA